MQEPSQVITGRSEDDLLEIVQELRRTPEALATLFERESEEILHHRPEGGWSAVEVVGHLAAHDAFERTQRFEAVLGEEHPRLPDDETRLQVAPANFQALTAAEALAFFRRERNLVVALLERLSPREWRRTGIHPREGERTLRELADLRGHDRAHVAQVRAAIADAKP